MANKNSIPFYDLSYQTKKIKNEFYSISRDVLNCNDYIQGAYVHEFEKQFANYLNISNVITVNSGTDALFLAALTLDLNANDIVFIQTNTYYATIESIARLGCQIQLCEIDIDSGQINLEYLEEKISEIRSFNPTQRIVVVVVHLFGSCTDLDILTKLSQDYNFIIIEDAAQAHGASFNGKMLGSFGLLSSFSFYPAKNLGAFGDGGAVATNSHELGEKVRALANHGQQKKDLHDFIGINSRLDTLQALVLSLKIKYLDEWNQMRKHIANIYRKNLQDCEEVRFLKVREGCIPNYHLFVVRVEKRQKLITYLEKEGVQCRVHYPNPIYTQKGFKEYQEIQSTYTSTEKFCSQIISLPMFPGLHDDDIIRISSLIKKFHS